MARSQVTTLPMRIASPSARAVVASVIVVTLGLSPTYLTGALGLQIRADLGLGATELGVAIGSFFLATAMLSPLLGALADRVGTVRSLRLVMVLLMISGTMMALVVRSLPALVLALVVGGMANGLAGPATSRLVAYHVRARRSLAFGLRQAAVPLATLLAGISVPVIGLAFGWRYAYVLVAVVALPVLLAAPAAVVGREGRGTLGTGRLHDLRGLLLVGLAFFFATAMGTALMAFMVDLSVDRGLAEATGGLILAAVSAAGIVVRVGVGWFADRPGVDAFAIMQWQIVIGLVGLVLLVLPTGPTGLVAGASLSIAGGWGWTGLMAHVVAQGSPQAPARAAGIVQTGGAGGGVLGPPLAGRLIDVASHDLTWSVMLVLLVLALAAVATARRSALAERFRQGPTIMEVSS
jgi:MFS family permease